MSREGAHDLLFSLVGKQQASGTVVSDLGGRFPALHDPGSASGSGLDVFGVEVVIIEVGLSKDDESCL